MRWKRKAAAQPLPSRNDVDAALDAMDAEALREVIRGMMRGLDDREYGRAASAIVNRAARGGSGWVPAPLDVADVAEVVTFAEAARRIGYADPEDVDERLHRGASAYLRKDYAAALRIFGALLRPIVEGDIDLGQRELVDEVLGIDAHACAVQYVVSAYMTSDGESRAETVRGAIDEVRGAGYFFEPLREMERGAIEALPDFDQFLAQWRAIVQREADGDRRNLWDHELDRWLREVVQRMEGSDGLATMARTTKRAADLRAWCSSLVEVRDWKAALSAFEEAATLVQDRERARGDFLDGAAFAAQELGRKDLSPWLERAWRAEPRMVRLRRWLGSARTRRAIHIRAAEALKTCPKDALRQRAFLHVVLGDFERAAKLLAAAPGLGWSRNDHPGHVLFPLFQTHLGGNVTVTVPGRPMGIDELMLRAMDPDEEPQLAVPEVEDIVRRAGVEGVPDDKARKAVLAAMRKAAEQRVAGVTDHKRRKYYGHAASLVAACVACDRSPATAAWAADLREAYRRYPALRAELDQRLS
jgi:tetratricopeptide (TPR) repeat protein